MAYYFFTAVRGLLLFTVVVLIGTGWSFLKPFLNEREKQVLLIVIPLQVFANIATIILDDNGPALNGWLEWRDLFHLLDIICCCAILFPIVWSIKHLREAAMTDGKKVRNMNKLILFRQFYVMVVAYIYFTLSSSTSSSPPRRTTSPGSPTPPPSWPPSRSTASRAGCSAPSRTARIST